MFVVNEFSFVYGMLYIVKCQDNYNRWTGNGVEAKDWNIFYIGHLDRRNLLI
jgi:hypothetical protein